MNKFATAFDISLDFLENLIEYSYIVEQTLNQNTNIDNEQKEKLLNYKKR